MRNRFGNITQLSATNWRGRVTIEGKQYLKFFATEESTRNWLATLHRQHEKDEFVLARIAEEYTLDQVAEHYRVFATHEGRTEWKKFESVKRNAPWLMKMKITDIRRHHIQEFRFQRLSTPCQHKPRKNDALLPPRPTKNVSPQTVNQELSILNLIFKHAMREMNLRSLDNPVQGTRMKVKKNEIAKRVSNQDVSYLIQAADHYELAWNSKLQISAFIRVALLTTTRRGALARAKWSDIAENGKTIYVPKAKNGRKYSLPLPAKAREIISKLPRTSEYIFGGNVNSLANAWARVRERGGVNVRFHDLRHEGITRLVESSREIGLTDFEIRMISGHQSDAAFSGYVHAHQPHVVNKIDEAGNVGTNSFGDDYPIEPPKGE